MVRAVARQVREATAKVVASASHVTIIHESIPDLVLTLPRKVERWWEVSPIHFEDLPLSSLIGVLLNFNSISFSYWGEPRWEVKVGARSSGGTWGMIFCFGRLLAEHPNLMAAERMAQLERRDLQYALRNGVEIPLLDERLAILREVGEVVCRLFGGRYEELVLESKLNAGDLLNLVVSSFPSFDDVMYNEGKKIPFHKRAQLFVADVDFHLRKRGRGGLVGVEELTACADYKLPQVLRSREILHYGTALAARIDGGEVLDRGSQMELEIRSATVQAVEAISHASRRTKRPLSPMEINDFLWLESQDMPKGTKPYHKVRTTAY